MKTKNDQTEDDIVEKMCHDMFNPTILESLNFEQKREIMNVLKRISPVPLGRHQAHITLSFWFIKQWYLHIVFGRDARTGKPEAGPSQQRTVIGWMLNIAFYLILGLGLVTIIFLLLYFFKTMLGIDLIPGKHLADLIRW